MSKHLVLILAVVVAGIPALAPGKANPGFPGSVDSIEHSQAASMKSALTQDDQNFMTEAAAGGMAEVELGRLVAMKAHSRDVKRFGQRMVRDHSKANAELKQLAKRKGVMLPTEMKSEHKMAKEKLSSLSGTEFDREYMKMMVEDHDKDVKAFEEKAASAGDPDLKRLVVKTLPTLKMHQSMAREIAAKN
jgi:putative membrane protein